MRGTARQLLKPSEPKSSGMSNLQPVMFTARAHLTLMQLAPKAQLQVAPATERSAGGHPASGRPPPRLDARVPAFGVRPVEAAFQPPGQPNLSRRNPPASRPLGPERLRPLIPTIPSTDSGRRGPRELKWTLSPRGPPPLRPGLRYPMNSIAPFVHWGEWVRDFFGGTAARDDAIDREEHTRPGASGSGLATRLNALSASTVGRILAPMCAARRRAGQPTGRLRSPKFQLHRPG
jgi:hypothetical protein